MDAVRKHSTKFDDWNPESFELNEAQLKTLLPLEVETFKGVILGNKHIPVKSVGSYIPGGRYPMFGSAQMSIILQR